MDLYGTLLKPLAFRMDPESVHEAALGLIADGGIRPNGLLDLRLEQKLFGVNFKNPLGLAAGFDKNGIAIDRWGELGFGFAELGTATNEPQPGNEKPRLFRLPEEEAVINRMGFNNHGAQALALRVAASQPGIPLGINIGKTKVVDIQRSPQDYQAAFRRVHRLGDYFVVNVSSPNTPGLRGLQDRGALSDVLDAMLDVDKTRPLFVKIAPDLSEGALEDVIAVATEKRLCGIVATNTTLRRDILRKDPLIEGGLSGKPIREVANETLRFLSSRAPRDMVLIGVGGIFTGADLFERIASGAHLCQIYTALAYRGPGAAPSILSEFIEALESAGNPKLEELRGSGVPSPDSRR